jgi:hypothetical protein
MYSALNKDERTEVDQLVEHVRRLADLQYYLQNADNVSRLQAKETGTDVNSIMQNKGCLISIGLFILGFVLVMISPELGVLAGLAAWVVGIVALIQLARTRRATNATQRTNKELASTIDLPRFRMLEQQFTTPDEAKQLQKQSEQYVETFFGDYTLLQDGWRS